MGREPKVAVAEGIEVARWPETGDWIVPGRSDYDTRENAAEWLWAALEEAAAIIRAAKWVHSQLEDLLERDVLENGSIRLGDTAYYVGSSVDRQMIDPEALLDWIGDQLRHVVPASSIRISGVRALAELRDLDPEVVESTFYETKYGEQELKKVPVSKRAWAQKLEHGERRNG